MSTGGGVWHLQLFGGLRAVRSGGDEVVDRFRSQKFGALLAYLALYPDRAHSREELADLFWPDAEPEAGRANLRAALSSLRRQFEPPGTPEGSVLLPQGRYHVRLGPGIASDVARFDASVAAARRAATPAERAAHFAEAAQAYGGPLLPGFYETWALNERERFEEAYRDAVGHLAAYWEREGDPGQALDWARRAVRADPLSEDANAGVIRLLLAAGQDAAARRQYDEFARLLEERLGDAPSPTLRALVASVPATSAAATAAARPRVHPPASSRYATAMAEAPPPAPTAAVPDAPLLLPVSLTRFFGREDEIAALVARLAGDAAAARLVTITGPGGSGKTRLALESARRLAERFVGGVFWVPLADVAATGEAVAAAVSEVVGLPPAPGSRSAREVAGALRARGPALLVLDNFEHLLEGGADADAADFLGSLLALAPPSLRCLVTSRRRLLLAGESEFPLSPLAVPAHPGTPARLLEFASVQMFVNRAQSARPDFQLTARNAAAVAALCEKLEGIPLAIELAAGWAEALTPAQMLQRLERRFDLLVARRRDLPPRHRTLRAAVESSYQELPPGAQRFFARLSAFRGGWTLDAAAAVTGDGNGAALAHLAELRERSLVTARPAADGDEEAYRFAMLETLREFAEEQLGADEAADLARRHAAFYADLAERAEPELRGPDQVPWLERLEREHPNLRAALAWSASGPGGDPAPGLRVAAAIWRFWMLRGHFAEGRRHLERVLAAAPDDGSPSRRVRAAALHGAGCLARLQGDTAAARPLLEAALAGMRSSTGGGTPLDVAMCLQNLAIVAQDGGDYAAARAGYEEALALRRAAGDLDGAANVLNSLGVLAWDLGDVAGSRAFHEESVALRRRLGQPPRAVQLLNLASVAERQGDVAAARAWFEEGVSLARAAGNLHTLATGLGGLALLATREGRRAEAGAHFAEALRLFLEVGDLGSLAQTLEGCAATLAAENGAAAATTSAARLWGAAGAYRARTGIPLSPGERSDHERAAREARAALGEDAFDAARDAGALLTPEQAVDEARAAFAA